MNFSEEIVARNPNDFCRYRDNKSLMRREAISIYDGRVVAWSSADALLQTPKESRLDVFGSIGDATWGQLK